MAEQDKYLLEYRPKIEWQVNILGMVESSELPQENQIGYKIPQEIQAMLDNPATNVLKSSFDLLDKIDQTLKELSECGKQSLEFQEYAKAIRENNFAIAEHYGQYHSSSLGGQTKAEVYGMLTKVAEEMNTIPSFVSKQFFGSDVPIVDTEKAKETEMAFFNQAISEDMVATSEHNLSMYGIRAAMIKAVAWRVQNTHEFVDSLSSLLSATLNDTYGGQIVELTRGFFDSPDVVVTQMQQMNSVMFAKYSKENIEVAERMARLNNPEIKEYLQLQAQDVALIKLAGLDLLRWAQHLDLTNESNSFISYIGDIATITEEVDDAFDKQLVDLYKYNVLDSQMKQSYIQTLKDKHKIRQVYNLLADISAEKDDETIPYLAADQFAKNRGLENPGNLCSEYAPMTIRHPAPKLPMAVEPMAIEIGDADAGGIPVPPANGGGNGGTPINTNELRVGNYRIAYNPSNQNLEVYYTEILS